MSYEREFTFSQNKKSVRRDRPEVAGDISRLIRELIFAELDKTEPKILFIKIDDDIFKRNQDTVHVGSIYLVVNVIRLTVISSMTHRHKVNGIRKQLDYDVIEITGLVTRREAEEDNTITLGTAPDMTFEELVSQVDKARSEFQDTHPPRGGTLPTSGSHGGGSFGAHYTLRDLRVMLDDK